MSADRSASAAAEILVVDDDVAVLSLVSTLLLDAGFAVATATTGEDALAAARARRPAAVILDVHLPGLSGYEVCRGLRETYGTSLPILFISGERTESFDRVAGLLLGADDYLAKPFSVDELLARVRSLLRRTELALPAKMTRLTEREREVLRLLAAGLDQRQIATALVISPKTVGSHIERILEKLGVNSRLQAVALAYREDLLRTAS